MMGSGLAKEARRRPEMDLLVGPIEAASTPAADRPVDAVGPAAPSMESPEASGRLDDPARREGG
jgi:hypothetical protein